VKTAGPYGGRVVINPTELRRGSKRLKDRAGDLKLAAGQLIHAPAPVTAPTVAGVPAAVHEAGSTLDALVQPLTAAGVELDRRALWAEIADQLVAGVPLTSAQLAEFMAGLRDGTLVQYAEPWQADLAGQYLGNMYRSNYKDGPDKLRELVSILRANGGAFDETHGAFFSGFINTFGETNVAHIARVIQEMEMPGAYQNVDGWHDNDQWYKYFQAGVRLSDQDAMDFMTTFGMAVAVATYTGQLTRWAPGAEEKIGYDGDAWSVAQLLSYKGTFGATFLRDVFQNGVIAQIGREAGNMSGMKPWESEIRIGGDNGINTDQTRLILDALERNPHAVALALSDPIPAELQISNLLQGNSNPIAILYDHMDWQDDGNEFASLYKTGVDWCYQNGDETRAYGMTASLIDRTINSDWRHLDPMTDALAHDLADHHMPDVFLSSTGAYPGGPSGDFQAGWVGQAEINGVTGLHLILDKGELVSLVRAMADQPSADEIFLQGARDYQGDLIRDHATQSSTADGQFLWATQLGDFDGIVMNAHDLDLAADFDKDNLKHQIFFKFIESTIGVVGEGHPLASAGTSLIVNGIDEATKPSYDALLQSTDDEKELLIASTHAAIAAGYYENGALGPEGAPPADLLVNGHLVPFTELKDPDKIRQFLLWVGTNEKLDHVAGEAFDRADQARDNRVYPAVPH
jgi:hypothetical protein